MSAKILVIDDERAIRNSLKDILEMEDFIVDVAEDGGEGISKLKATKYDAIITDIKMPVKDGLEVLEEAKIICPEVPVIMISGHGTIEIAVDAVKRGAFDFISKPPDLTRLLITVRNATEKGALIQETKTLRKKIAKKAGKYDIVGNSPALMDIMGTINKVAPTDARVLILGQNGVGKELIARRIHELSNRLESPLIEVNCAAIPSELIESELFGHEKGSFTSAIKQRLGKFEQANGGTLFLDEIGDMSLSAQAKVLRALQEGTITRVGGDKDIKVNVRVIAATNKDLMAEVEAKNFRLDLYHRLSVIVLKVPSLNDRSEDIPLLVDHFIKDICEEYNHPPMPIEDAALKRLQEYNWTGNIRELRNAVERLCILSDKMITEENVKQYIFMK